MMNWNDGGGAGGWLILFPMMIIFWGAVVWAIIAAVRHNSASNKPDSHGQSGALQILDDRFARGEIDEQEYRSRRDAIQARG